jgi:tetratricopeptide (TPR) repeat protein
MLLLFTCFICCNKIVKDSKNGDQNVSIPGDYFESEEASELNELGIELSKNGDYDDGKLAFIKSLEIEPNNPTTLSNIGLNRFLVYDYDSAIEYYQKSYRNSDSTYHISAINMGLTYYYMREFQKGIDITSYVINNDTTEVILSTAYVHRALNYIGNNNCERAKSDLDFIIQNFRGIGRTEFHIQDLKEKLEECE